MRNATLKVLDCTFRDGGYYNDWFFKPETVRAYLECIDAAGVDIVELGFRLPPQKEFRGPFAYSTDRFLQSLNVPSRLRIAVMVNARDLLEQPGSMADSVAKLFAPRADSLVSIVRIASHLRDVERCDELAFTLRELGYEVGLNLMQVGGKSLADINRLVAAVQNWRTVNVLYFADSLGSMTPDDVRPLVSALADSWNGELGIHTHDNMGLALVNALAAIEAGATWIDGTVLGMGRGAGNARTEHLLVELVRRYQAEYNPAALFPLVLEDFEQLRKQYGWGPNLLYYLSAAYGIHPTYVQEMLARNHHESHQIIQGLETLRNSGSQASFQSGVLNQALLGVGDAVEGTWSPNGWAEARDVLIVGPGPGTRTHRQEITSFIRSHNPLVLCLNTHEVIASELVTAYAACHHSRILMEADRYRNLNRPLIIPVGLVPERLRNRLLGVEVLDYGVHVEEGSFELRDHSCTIPSLLVAAYALAVATRGGAKRILLAGFDGYGSGDPRQDAMGEVFRRYLSHSQSVPLIAITPTSYPLEQGSVYSPSI